jgi:hypothetical protein
MGLVGRTTWRMDRKAPLLNYSPEIPEMDRLSDHIINTEPRPILLIMRLKVDGHRDNRDVAFLNLSKRLAKLHGQPGKSGRWPC